MRHNIRDEKGRFVKKSSCDCGKSTSKRCKGKCKNKASEDLVAAVEIAFDGEVTRFILASIKAAMDITMSTNKKIEDVANSELCWEDIPDDLKEDFKALGITTVYDFGKYIVVSRNLVNDAIEVLGSQLTKILKK